MSSDGYFIAGWELIRLARNVPVITNIKITDTLCRLTLISTDDFNGFSRLFPFAKFHFYLLLSGSNESEVRY